MNPTNAQRITAQGALVAACKGYRSAIRNGEEVDDWEAQIADQLVVVYAPLDAKVRCITDYEGDGVDGFFIDLESLPTVFIQL